MTLLQIKTKPSEGYGDIALLLFGAALAAAWLALYVTYVRP